MASTQATVPDPTSVYRYYDQSDLLIYVGITRQGMGRNVQHNGKAEWWPFVTRQEVEHLPSRAAAMLREKALIRKYRPPFNKQHNPDYHEAHAAYLAYVTTFLERPDSPQGLLNKLNKRLPLDVVSFEPGTLILRSQLPHAPLARAIDWNQEQPVVRGRRRKYGVLNLIEAQGPFTVLTCRVKNFAPEEGFSSGEALLGWVNNAKPQYPYIRAIEVTEADWVPPSERPGYRPGYKVVKHGPDTLILPRGA